LHSVSPGATLCHVIQCVKPRLQDRQILQGFKKAKIKDVELCLAIQQVLLGQVDDLGGGVFKKRLNSNLHRSIILAKGGKYWVYEYLFAKKDRANIENDELLAFRLLANSYAGLTEQQVSQLLVNGDFVEICHDDKKEIQK
jgi:hypothetical protein